MAASATATLSSDVMGVHASTLISTSHSESVDEEILGDDGGSVRGETVRSNVDALETETGDKGGEVGVT